MQVWKVRWLPLGHIAHGYRRVFVVDGEDQKPQRVIVISPMPYEAVYEVGQLADEKVDDPALWWGLSIVRSVLLQADAMEASDDGFLNIRASRVETTEFLSIEQFKQAMIKHEFVIELGD